MNILDFTFNGKKLSDFECICCNFDNSSGTVEVSSGADVTLNQEKPLGSNKFNLYSTSYDEPFTLPVVNTYQDDYEEVRNKIKSNLKCNVQITYNPTAMIGYGYKS